MEAMLLRIGNTMQRSRAPSLPDMHVRVVDMFNGKPIIDQISDTEFRITGISLPPEQSMTLGFEEATGDAPDIVLNARAPRSLFDGKSTSIASLTKVDINPNTTGGFTNLQPTVEKIGGEDGESFRVKITNTHREETTQGLEIYVTLLGQRVRRGDQSYT